MSLGMAPNIYKGRLDFALRLHLPFIGKQYITIAR